MKAKWIYVSTLIIILSTLFTVKTFAYGGSVYINAEPTKVANLIYIVQDNFGNPIPDGTNFILKYGDEIKDCKTLDSKLIIENLSFGQYEIIPNNGKYYGNMYVNIDKNYVETQHLSKKYIVYTNKDEAFDQIDLGNGETKIINNKDEDLNINDLPQTGYETANYKYIGLFLIFLGIFLFNYTKQRSE